MRRRCTKCINAHGGHICYWLFFCDWPYRWHYCSQHLVWYSWCQFNTIVAFDCLLSSVLLLPKC
jgi:hypothetical protein